MSLRHHPSLPSPKVGCATTAAHRITAGETIANHTNTHQVPTIDDRVNQKIADQVPPINPITKQGDTTKALNVDKFTNKVLKTD